MTEEPAEDLGEPQADYLGPALKPEVPHPIAGKKYDPARSGERMRGAVALASIGLFAFVVAFLTWDVVVNRRSWNDVQGLATSVLPVVVSVVGTTTGFYFGTNRSN